MTKFRNALHNEKGFTLIELLVVIIIIGILAAIAIPNLIGQSDKARIKSVKADLKVIQSAVDAYYSESGKYPVQADLVGDTKMLKTWPKDPWGTAYTFTDPGLSTFVIDESKTKLSLNKDGIQGTEELNP